MGFDTVYFLFAVEDAFGVAITNEEARASALPGTWSITSNAGSRVASERPVTANAPSTAYAVRCFTRIGCREAESGPTRRGMTSYLAGISGAAGVSCNGSSASPSGHDTASLEFGASAARTIGATADYIARKAPAAIKGPDEGWTRPEIERTIRTLIADDLGIASFSWDDSFVTDLRVD